MTQSNVQQILVIVKPDAMVRGLSGLILNKLAETKLELVGAKMIAPSQKLVEEHYKQLSDKPFYKGLVEYLQGKLHNCPAVLALVYRGPDAILKIRTIAGATNPEEADSVSIRGAFGRITTKGVFENVIHASSDAKDSEREIKLWFRPEEIVGEIYPTKKVQSQAHEVVAWA
jgi:nucleoside-diphosphate kinase